MTNLVFLVHGMGSHGDGWEEPAVETLKKAYDSYQDSQITYKTFEERFSFVPLEYGSIFQDIVEGWQENATNIATLAPTVGADQVTNLVGWLTEAGVAEDNFIWSHAADVLMYRLFADVRDSVKVHLANQMIPQINKLTRTSDTWSVLAHSLGTAVIHDTLDMIWNGSLPDGSDTGLGVNNNQARLICMIANVSRVLQTQPVAYKSLVQPGPAGQSGCLYYHNVRHILDPFTIPKMFKPDKWPTENLAKKKKYKYIELDHYHERNIHDLSHYLKHPDVHIPFFIDALGGYEGKINQKDRKNVTENFSQFGLEDDNAAILLKQIYEEIGPGTESQWFDFRALWDLFTDRLKLKKP